MAEKARTGADFPPLFESIVDCARSRKPLRRNHSYEKKTIDDPCNFWNLRRVRSRPAAFSSLGRFSPCQLRKGRSYTNLLFKTHPFLIHMAGQNQGLTIQLIKGPLNQKRGQLFPKFAFETTDAVNAGTGDPAISPHLHRAFSTVRAQTTPVPNTGRAYQVAFGHRYDASVVSRVAYRGLCFRKQASISDGRQESMSGIALLLIFHPQPRKSCQQQQPELLFTTQGPIHRAEKHGGRGQAVGSRLGCGSRGCECGW